MNLLSIASECISLETYRLKAENALLKELISHGEFKVLWESTDCDHMTSERVKLYQDIETLRSEISEIGEWAEGRVSVSLVERYDDGSYM